MTELYDGGCREEAQSCGVVSTETPIVLQERLRDSQEKLGIDLLFALSTKNSAALLFFTRDLGLHNQPTTSHFGPAVNRFEDQLILPPESEDELL